MQIKILKNYSYSFDGMNVESFEEGQTIKIIEPKATILIEKEVAEIVEESSIDGEENSGGANNAQTGNGEGEPSNEDVLKYKGIDLTTLEGSEIKLAFEVLALKNTVQQLADLIVLYDLPVEGFTKKAKKEIIANMIEILFNATEIDVVTIQDITAMLNENANQNIK